MENQNQEKLNKPESHKCFLGFYPIPTCRVSSAFNILEASQSFLQMAGYDITEILGENIDFLFTDKFAFDALSGQLKSQGEIRGFNIKLKNKKGQLIIAQLLAKKIADNQKESQGQGYIFSFLDITLSQALGQSIQLKIEQLEQDTKDLKDTRMALINILEDVDDERKKAEIERDKTIAIINNFADGLMIIENDKVVLINPKAKDFFQTTDKETVGKSLKELVSHPTLRDLVDMVEQEKSAFLRKELSLGVSLMLEVSVVFINSPQEYKRKIIILHDITRENFVERMKTEFVSIAAHQLRTPLSAIKWILKMFLDGDMGELTETQAQFLEKTYESNERMINLVNDLLSVTKIEEGRFLQKMQKQDMADVILEAVSPLKETAQKKSLILNFTLPSKRLPKVLVDKEKIILAIQNIVENAIDYTKFGKINVITDYIPPQNEFMVRVQDTGIGIPENQKVRIFSKFFRGVTALKTETEGTGLGLFIAKNIIEAHSGKIWFDSEEGKGTTFYFTLPVDGKIKS
ncbi:MAG: ATP-binding protein [Candidatus Pacebacteria bacterium]|nr:ATP-binding protein [Candidatus Paceibacterota bacterium]